MPLFLIHGESGYRVQETLHFYVEGFKKKYDATGLNISFLDGLDEDVTAARIEQEVSAVPFLAEKRLVVVSGLPSGTDKSASKESISDKEQELADWLAQVPESTVLVFVNGSPDKRKTFFKKLIAGASKVEELNQLSDSELKKWILAKEPMEEGVAEYFIETVGKDLFLLENELAKLQLYRAGEPITRKDINLLTHPTLSDRIFDLTDAIAQKDCKKSLRIFANLIELGESPFAIFPMIIWNFRTLVMVKSKLEEGVTDYKTIMSDLKLAPFTARKAISQGANYSLEKLKNIYERLLEIDLKVKTGVITTTTSNTREYEMEIEKLILEFSR